MTFTVVGVEKKSLGERACAKITLEASGKKDGKQIQFDSSAYIYMPWADVGQYPIDGKFDIFPAMAEERVSA